MTKLFFVRHAQPEHVWDNDRTRPLTDEGTTDAAKVLDFCNYSAGTCIYCMYRKKMIQGCLNPIATGDFKWI